MEGFCGRVWAALPGGQHCYLSQSISGSSTGETVDTKCLAGYSLLSAVRYSRLDLTWLHMADKSSGLVTGENVAGVPLQVGCRVDELRGAVQ